MEDTDSTALVMSGGALAARDPDLVPTMVSDVAGAKARLAQLQEFVREVMVAGEDFGVIPGTKKPVLLKPGAEKLCEIYGYAQQVEITNRIEDWDRPFFHYEARCDLVSKRSGKIVGSGVGSCNSMEARYRWRDAQRLCPQCQQPAIIKGKEEYGGGFLCFQKKGGCGAKFADEAPEILEQALGRVENDDVHTLVNTILKMAKKRAVVDATLSVTRSSALFTQDEEAIEHGRRPEETRGGATAPGPQRQAGKPGHISEPQAKRLVARAKAAGHTTDELLVWLGREYDVHRLSEITRGDYDAIIERVDRTAPLTESPDGMKREDEIPFDEPEAHEG